MFEDGSSIGGSSAVNGPAAGSSAVGSPAIGSPPVGRSDAGVLSTDALVALKGDLLEFDDQADPSARIDRIRALEELKSAVAAAQARETAAFVAAQRATFGESSARARGAAERALTAQVGLAKRSSPFHAQRYCGWAMILTSELPATFAQLQAGRVTEWRAMIMARETAWLSRADRTVVDSALAPHLQQWGDARVEAAAKTLAYQLDPTGYLARIRGAQADRRVSIRPAPDVMARLSALLPAAQGIAAHTSLAREADRLRAQGDTRSRGQIMADTLVQRLTGQATADDIAVEIELIMTDETLFGGNDADADADADNDNDTPAEHQSDPQQPAAGRAGADNPGHLIGYGPIPASVARDIALGRQAPSHTPCTQTPSTHSPCTQTPSSPAPATQTSSAGGPRWLRRLYTSPNAGDLAAMDSRRRLFTPAQRRFIRLRDQGICRTPWCDAAIRHTDHIRPHTDNGPTTVHNGQGLCQTCNLAKEAPGWRSEPLTPGAAPDIVITTPTGHHYTSPAPPPPGRQPGRPPGRPPDSDPIPIQSIDDAAYFYEHRAS